MRRLEAEKRLCGGGMFLATDGRELWYRDSGSIEGVLIATSCPSSSMYTPETDRSGSRNDRSSTNSDLSSVFAGHSLRSVGILHDL